MSEQPSKYQYQWRVSFDGGEVYGDPHNSKEDAVAEARERPHGGLIAECLQQDFDLSITGDSIIEALYGQNEDQMNDAGEFIDPSEEQTRDLGEMVSDAIAAWVEKHSIDTKAWMFADTKNDERVEGAPEDAA